MTNLFKKCLALAAIGIFFMSLFGAVLVPIVVSAQASGSNATQTGGGGNATQTSGGGGNGTQVTFQNPLGSQNSTLPQVIYTIYTGFLTIMTAVLAFFIVYCGFLFVRAQGNEKKVGEAKAALGYTLLGGALILGAWTLAGIISSTITSVGNGTSSTVNTGNGANSPGDTSGLIGL